MSIRCWYHGICEQKHRTLNDHLLSIQETDETKFGATVFCSYAALNWSYALIYIPGSGIMAAYTGPDGAISPEFNQSIALYMWLWFIVSVLFTVAAYRSTWIIFCDLISVDLCLLLLACGFMVGKESVLTAGYSFGMVACFLSCKSCIRMGEDLANWIQTGLVALRCGPIQPLSSFLCSRSALPKLWVNGILT